MTKNILITGGAGFIGSNLAIYLQENYPSFNITVFDIFNDGSKLPNGNDKFLGSFMNLRGFKGEVICGDIRNQYDLMVLNYKKFDIIFHLAAISDTRVEDQSLIMKNNINPFYHFHEMAKLSGAKLVYASSASVYGSSNRKTLSIGHENPQSPYAYSKYSMDCCALSAINSSKNLKLVGLRYFNVYGLGENYKGRTSSTIFQFASQLLNGQRPTLFVGSEKIFRDFVYIKDVVQATVKAGLSDVNGVFNVGTGRARSFLEVVNTVQNVLGTNLDINYIQNPYLSGYQFFTEADISKTISNLNYKCDYQLEEGISDYLSLMENNY
jgi:ADP-L-glycero-D-manno-heptose 6-epimerase